MRIFIAIGLLIISGTAFGAVPQTDVLDGLVGAYKAGASAWEPILKRYALSLFWMLVAIDFLWGAMKLATQNSEFDSVFGFIFNRIMTIGFFFALLSFGSTWSLTIIDSFRQLAGIAGGSSSLDPSYVMEIGLEIVTNLLNVKVGLITGIIPGLLAVVASIIIIVAFILITTELIFVLVSMWVVLYAGIIMLAFGGSSWTQSYAINYYKSLLAIAVKLFVIQLLVGIGVAVIRGWTTGLSNPSISDMFVILSGAVILYVLVKNIGGLVESLINGTGAASTSGSGAVTSALTSVGAVAAGGAAVAASTVGAGQAVSAASQLAKANGATGMGAISQTAGNLAKSFSSDLSNKIGGDMSAQHGTAGGRMANIMKDQMAESQAKGGDSSGGDSNYISGVQSSDSDAGSKA